MNMINIIYMSTEGLINKLQDIKGKTKLKFYKHLHQYYDNMNIRFDEYTFSKNPQRISKIYHEVLLLKKFLQTKLQVKKMNINYYDFYYTVIKNGREKDNEKEQKEIVDNQYENDFISLNDVIIPNHFVGMKDRGK